MRRRTFVGGVGVLVAPPGEDHGVRRGVLEAVGRERGLVPAHAREDRDAGGGVGGGVIAEDRGRLWGVGSAPHVIITT